MQTNHFNMFVKNWPLIFTLSLGLKLYFLRIFLFDDYNFLNTLFLELSYAIIVFLIIELTAKTLKFHVCLVFDLIISFLFFAIVVYYSYFGTVPNYYDLFQIDQVATIKDSVTQLVSPVYLLFFADIIVFMLLLLLRKVSICYEQAFNRKVLSVLLTVSIGFCIFQFSTYKNEKLLDPLLIALEKGVINYQFLKIYGDKVQSVTATSLGSQFSNEDIIKLKGNQPISQAEHNFFGVDKNKNLIMVQFESLQDNVIGLEVNGNVVTPNLNKLAEKHFYFPNIFQQIGAGNTSDAEFMVNTSLYSAGSVAVSEEFADKRFPSLPRLLSKKGYQTMTFHTDEISYWNRDVISYILL